MAEKQKHISIKDYQYLILKEYASKTNRVQKVYYQTAIDEFIKNHQNEIQEQGINSGFLKKESKKNQNLLKDIPLELKEIFKLEED